MAAGRTLKSNALYFGYQGVMVKWFEQKDELVLLFKKNISLHRHNQQNVKPLTCLLKNKEQKKSFP